MKFTRSLLFLLLMVSVLVSPLWAEERTAFEQILARAYHRDPQIRAKRQELNAVKEGSKQAWSGYLPQVQSTGEFGTFYYSDPLQRDGTQKIAGLEVSQLVYDSGRVDSRVKQAHALVKKMEWELESLSQGILLETINGYLKYHEFTDVLKLHEQNEANLAEQFKSIQEEVEAGLNLITNENLVESRYQLAQARCSRAENQMHQSRIVLERLAGPLPTEFLAAPLVDFDKKYILPSSLQEALDKAMAGFPSVQSAMADVDASRAAYKHTKAELLPTVFVKGSLQTGRFGETNSDAASAHIVFNMPLFQGGANWSKMRQARNTVKQRQYLVAATEQRLHEEVKIIWAEISSLSQVEEIWQHALELEYQALEGVKEQVRYEIVPLRELLQSQEDIVQKEIEFKGIFYQKTAERFKLLQLVDGDSLLDFGG